MTVSMICALGTNRAIGRGQALLWRLPDDLRRFRRLTTGHPVVMGRRTWETIGRPLPGRTNIVLTRRAGFHAEGAAVCGSLAAALAAAAAAEGGDETFVIGGGDVYAQALPLARRLYLTLVDDAPPDADAFFPDYGAFSRVVREEPGADTPPRYRFVVLERAVPLRGTGFPGVWGAVGVDGGPIAAFL